MTDPLIGKKIGQYEVVSLLGQGGMAVVYRAHQTTMKRDVAMKVLTSLLAQEPTFKERFDQEVELVAKLEHAHIVPVHDHGTTEEGIFYLTMRYIKGGTLTERIHNGTPVTLVEANNILQQIAGALDYAHKHGVIHRDMKPSNILLDEQGNIYLTDFGLARMVNEDLRKDLTAADTFIGTPSYVSPEQITQKGLDERSDEYSLAVVVFEMLAGKPPFTGDSAFAIMRSHVEDKPPSLRQFRPDIPEAVESVIMRALSKDPDSRYPSVQEFYKAFNQATQGEITTQKLEPVLPTIAPSSALPKLRLRTLFPVAVVLVLLIVMGVLEMRSVTAPSVSPTASPSATLVPTGAATQSADSQAVVVPVPTVDESQRKDKGTPDDVKIDDGVLTAAQNALSNGGFIGFVACSLKTDYHASLARAVRIRAQDLKLPVQIVDSAEDKTQQPVIVNRFVAQGAKAIIACELDRDSIEPALKDAQQAGIKVIRMSDFVLGANSTSITYTNEAMGEAVGNYTADMINNTMSGKAVVAILDFPQVPIVVKRADTMETTLKTKAPNVTIVGRYIGGLPENGEKSMAQALSDHPDINVVMSINDAGAYGAIKALEKAGKKPDEVKIISVDAENEARRMINQNYFFVASVDSGAVSSGKLAVEAAADLLANVNIPKQLFLSGNIVTHDSLLTPTP